MKTFIRRLAILDYLRSAKVHRSTDEVLNYLLANDYIDSNEVTESSYRRTIQRDMNFLYGSTAIPNADSYNDFGLEVTRGEGKSLLWKLDPYSSLAYDFEKMPSYLALSFAMTQKHLSGILPRQTLYELERFFQNADSKLQQQESTISPKQYRRLKDSIEFYQRGQRLQPAPFDINLLDTIYRGILKGRQIEFNYRNKRYQVHPFGVVILLPKLYFLAKKSEDLNNPDGYRSFLIHKMSAVVVTDKVAAIPDDFSLKEYLEAGNMDVYLSSDDRQSYRLRILLNTQGNDHLIENLIENPISEDQALEKQTDGGYHLIATVKRTVQLKNWIIGLGSVATVLEPEEIRGDIYGELSKLMKNYE